ncbi:hypothetical protein JCM4914_73120 [Streptomyces platensis subsp. malvinus]
MDAVVTEVGPHVVVNASSGKEDWAVTAQGPVRLAIAAARVGSHLVHVSSDAVFSGSRVHYDESCLPDPLTPYGAAKAAAETGILLVQRKLRTRLRGARGFLAGTADLASPGEWGSG